MPSRCLSSQPFGHKSLKSLVGAVGIESYDPLIKSHDLAELHQRLNCKPSQDTGTGIQGVAAELSDIAPPAHPVLDRLAGQNHHP